MSRERYNYEASDPFAALGLGKGEKLIERLEKDEIKEADVNNAYEGAIARLRPDIDLANPTWSDDQRKAEEDKARAKLLEAKKKAREIALDPAKKEAYIKNHKKKTPTGSKDKLAHLTDEQRREYNELKREHDKTKSGFETISTTLFTREPGGDLIFILELFLILLYRQEMYNLNNKMKKIIGPPDKAADLVDVGKREEDLDADIDKFDKDRPGLYEDEDLFLSPVDSTVMPDPESTMMLSAAARSPYEHGRPYGYGPHDAPMASSSVYEPFSEEESTVEKDERYVVHRRTP